MSTAAETELTAAQDTPAKPFKFLDYYTKDDTESFAGREKEAREIVGRILREPTLVLFGRSGLGKTSLLLAGVLPKFPAQHYLKAYVRTLDSAIDDLFAALVEASGQARLPGQTLREFLGKIHRDRSVLLVFDQFEEFFIRFRSQPGERAEFIREIAGVLADQELDVRIVFSLREDYLAELDEFRHELPELFDNQFRLLPLTAFGARRAISSPLEQAGIGFEPQLLIALVDMLADFGFDPAILQIVCTEVYRVAEIRSKGLRPYLRLVDLEQVGGIDGIFQRYIQAATAAIADQNKLLARNLLDALITQERTKRAVTVAHLQDADFSAEPVRVREVIDELYRQRIVRRENRLGVFWYELLHERLISHVEAWLKLDREYYGFRVARKLIANGAQGEAWREDPNLLLTEGQMAGLVDRYREHFRLQGAELEFVVWSAVYSAPRSVPFWAEKYDVPKSRELVLRLMGKQHAHDVRLSAVVAAGTLAGEHSADLARECVRVTLEDDSADIRQAAAESLVHLASDIEIVSLGGAAAKREQRQRALDALAVLHNGGRAFQNLGGFTRFRAKRRARERILHANEKTIRDQGRAGLVAGTFAAMTWTATVGALFMAFLQFTAGVKATDPLLLIAAWLGVSGVLVGLFGALSARVASRSITQQTVLGRRQASWARAILGTFGSWFFVSAFALACGVTLWAFDEASYWPLVFFSLVVVTSLLESAWFVGMARPLVSRERNGTAAHVLLLIASIGWPFVVPGVLLLLFVPIADRIPEFDINLAYALGLTTAFMASSQSFILAAALGYAARKQPDPNRTLSAGVWPARSALAIGSLITVSMVTWWFGWDNVPYLAPTVQLTEEEPTYLWNARLGAATEHDVAHLNVELPKNLLNPVYVERTPLDGGLKVGDYYFGSKPEGVAVLTRGRHVVAIDEAISRDFEVRTTLLPTTQSRIIEWPARSHFALVPVDDGGGVHTARISGSWPRAAGVADRLRLKLYGLYSESGSHLEAPLNVFSDSASDMTRAVAPQPELVTGAAMHMRDGSAAASRWANVFTEPADTYSISRKNGAKAWTIPVAIEPSYREEADGRLLLLVYVENDTVEIPKELPQGSRVVFKGAERAVRVTLESQLQEGVPVFTVEGTWSSGQRALSFSVEEIDEATDQRAVPSDYRFEVVRAEGVLDLRASSPGFNDELVARKGDADQWQLVFSAISGEAVNEFGDVTDRAAHPIRLKVLIAPWDDFLEPQESGSRRRYPGPRVSAPRARG